MISNDIDKVIRIVLYLKFFLWFNDIINIIILCNSVRDKKLVFVNFLIKKKKLIWYIYRILCIWIERFI